MTIKCKTCNDLGIVEIVTDDRDFTMTRYCHNLKCKKGQLLNRINPLNIKGVYNVINKSLDIPL